MKILIATDAWKPQVNGVVRTLERLAEETGKLGVDVRFLTPEGRRSIPLPGYPEIRITVETPADVARTIEAEAPDALHISTEGPIGWFARRHAIRRGRPFSTCYHTRYPEYLAARLPVPAALTYGVLRRFHNAAAVTLVATEALRQELSARGFRNLALWSRGVDGELFRPRAAAGFDFPRPIFLFVGRVAVEKNVEAFLAARLPGTKVVVGEGPDRARLEARFPEAVFMGARFGEDLARIYAAADVFVFPSRTDTFGLVLLEALASGTPVAAFPQDGILSDIAAAGCGVLAGDLEAAALRALEVPRSECRAFALGFTHERTARQFLDQVTGLARPAAA
jgi:glycosyltransferase involved in cell wall biosynthesis